MLPGPGEDVELYPGDLVDVWYEVKGEGYLTNQAISAAKRAAASDPRFHYQGSRFEDIDEGFEAPTRYLVITLQVADPNKITGSNPAGSVVGPDLASVTGGELGGEQNAGWGLNLALIVAGIGAVLGGIYEGRLIFRDATVTPVVQSIANDPTMPADVKIAALNALGEKDGLGKGLSALGGGLATVALILAGVYIYSRFRG